jgi:hypothetical protein
MRKDVGDEWNQTGCFFVLGEVLTKMNAASEEVSISSSLDHSLNIEVQLQVSGERFYSGAKYR